MNTRSESFSFLPRAIRQSDRFINLIRYLKQDPDRLSAVKACFVIAILAIPPISLGKPFFAVSLVLGALAGALSETDDHPRGRIKALIIKTGAFFVSSTAVEILLVSPLLLAAGLGISTILCVLVGGISDRFRGITFGTLLVGLYTMIGSTMSPAPYWQPILLPAGSLVYGLFSLWILSRNPWRLLDEQLGRGYLVLARYLETKARLFPSNTPAQKSARNSLAVINQQLVLQLDGCRALLNSYNDYTGDNRRLRLYLNCFMLLQSLHERAASSHQRYDTLSNEPAHAEIIEGIGAATRQLADAVRQFAGSLLTGDQFTYPIALDWLLDGLKNQLERQRIGHDHSLYLIISNLTRSGVSLYNLQDDRLRHLAPRLAQDRRTNLQRFIDQWSWNDGRLRHALRLSLCFVAGFAIAETFSIAKGEWIVLTSLFVCQPSYGETRRKLLQRILGTFTGVIGGILLVQILPTTPGKIVLLLLATYAFFLWLRRNYAVSVIFVTIFVLCAFDFMTGAGVAIMLPRIIDTVLGSTLALLSVRILWPEWQYKRLPQLLRDAFDNNRFYFGAILGEYRKQDLHHSDDLEYRIARRKAHRSDSALVTAWRDMQVEPRKYRLFSEEAYRMTHLNHALLSYISAFGAHRTQYRSMETHVAEMAEGVLLILRKTGESVPAGSGSTATDVKTSG